MIRAVAPGRVNLIGDHTDYTGGLVLPMAIDRATVVEGNRGGDSIEIDSRELGGHVSVMLPADHADPHGPEWGRYVSAVAGLVKPREGLTATISTDIPVGGGLSSSAALEVALALALGADPDPVTLAGLCQRAENIATGVPTGIMDQMCILSATEGNATLIDCSSLSVEHVPVPEDVAIVVRFVAHRTLEGSAYADRVEECRRAEDEIGPLRAAGVEDTVRITDSVIRARARHVVTENDRVLRFADAMRRGDWAAAGQLMTESHRSLAADYGVSTAGMDSAVAGMLATPGVLGSRMTGGGFGGCIVSLCRPDADVPGWHVRAAAGASVVSRDQR